MLFSGDSMKRKTSKCIRPSRRSGGDRRPLELWTVGRERSADAPLRPARAREVPPRGRARRARPWCGARCSCARAGTTQKRTRSAAVRWLATSVAYARAGRHEARAGARRALGALRHARSDVLGGAAFLDPARGLRPASELLRARVLDSRTVVGMLVVAWHRDRVCARAGHSAGHRRRGSPRWTTPRSPRR